MPKKLRVRSLMDGQHVKGCERLIKSARQYFYHIFYSILKEVSSKNSFLVVPEILRLFVVCVFILFHLLVSSGCTTPVIYVRSSDQRSFVASIFWVLLPSSFISVSESILFHLQRRKLQPTAYWRENDMI